MTTTPVSLSSSPTQQLKQRIIKGGNINENEALFLLQQAEEKELYEAAHQITQHFMGKQFDTCSIMNAKCGNCPEDCKWCAQSAHYTTGIATHRLVGTQEVLKQVQHNTTQKIKRFSLVASGRRSSNREIDYIAFTYQQIKAALPQVKCCASLGLLREEQLQKLFDAGVTTYHCNIETAPSHFPTLCTTHTQADKEATLAAARRVGMRICSGGIIGMGESEEQRIEMLFYLRQLRSESIPINILQPIPGTPLAENPPLSETEILRFIAVARFVHPKAYLRFSGGRAQLSLPTQYKAIYIGINAAITGDLLTTIGQQTQEDMEMIAACNKENCSEDWELSYSH